MKGDPSKLREKILEQQRLGLDVTNVREDVEAGKSLALLAAINEDSMVIKCGSGGLATPEEAIGHWKELFRVPGGGVDFAEIGRCASHLSERSDT